MVCIKRFVFIWKTTAFSLRSRQINFMQRFIRILSLKTAHHTCVKPAVCCFGEILNFRRVQKTVRLYLHKEITFCFCDWRRRDRQGPLTDRWKFFGKIHWIIFVQVVIYVKLKLFTEKQRFFTAKLNNQLLGTIYKDSDPESAPNVCLNIVSISNTQIQRFFAFGKFWGSKRSKWWSDDI